MSEERLQEIKDSVDFQKQILMAHNMETLCVDEEQELIEEIERLNNIIEHIENICKSSIASVDKILLDEKEIKVKDGIVQNKNNYQIVRLKAYRTKSKEILGRIKELKGSDKE